MRELFFNPSTPSTLLGIATLSVSALSLVIAGLSLKVVRLQLAAAKKPLGMGMRFGVQDIGIRDVRNGRTYATCLINFDVVGPGVLHDVHFYAWTSDSFLVHENEWIPVSKEQSIHRVDSSTGLEPVKIVVPAAQVDVAKLGVMWAETSSTGGIITQAVRMIPRPKNTRPVPDALGTYEMWVPGKSRVPVRAAQWLLRRTTSALPSGQLSAPKSILRALSPRGGRFKAVIEPPQLAEYGPLSPADWSVPAKVATEIKQRVRICL
ncbi:MAG TPA: hypothetical protein H9759_08115 [Candidatus Dietzia intestinipullorum]|nr:hypothetical protein [Candidatus Dietzia intestinipullorum]